MSKKEKKAKEKEKIFPLSSAWFHFLEDLAVQVPQSWNHFESN